MTNGASNSNNVPSSLTLLLIQAGGGLLSLLPIASLRNFADLSDRLYWMLVVGAAFNVLLSVLLLIGRAGQLSFYLKTVGGFGELGLCRAALFYDTIMLGTLVFCTGGAEKSAFAPQFAAILPIAMLIPDSPLVKWSYAGLFLLMFLIGLTPLGAFHDYIAERPEKQIWFLVFFFIFTAFPAAYSIQAERANRASQMTTI